MHTQLQTLHFQGKPIYYLKAADGGNLVLIRPLCDALGVDADWQIRELKADEMLAPEVCEHTTQVPGQGQARAWTCLPEKFIYGWIFGIKMSNTMRPETKASLATYKSACYEVLYDHFHGQIRQAQLEVSRKASNAAEIARLRERIEAGAPEDFQRIRELEAENKRIGNPLGRLQNSQFRFEFESATTEE